MVQFGCLTGVGRKGLLRVAAIGEHVVTETPVVFVSAVVEVCVSNLLNWVCGVRALDGGSDLGPVRFHVGMSSVFFLIPVGVLVGAATGYCHFWHRLFGPSQP